MSPNDPGRENDGLGHPLGALGIGVGGERLADLLIGSDSGQVVAREIVECLAQSLGTDDVALLAVQPDGGELAPIPGCEPVGPLARAIETQIEEGITDWIMRDGKPVSAPDLDASAGGAQIIAIPIVLSGTPVAIAYARGRVSPHGAVLRQVQRSAVLAYPMVRMTHLETYGLHLARTIEAFVATGKAITRIDRVEALMYSLLGVATRFTDSKGSALLMMDKTGEYFTIRAANPELIGIRGPLSAKGCIVGLAVSSAHGLLVNGVSSDERFGKAGLLGQLGDQVQHAMATPVTEDGTPRGAIVVFSDREEAPYTFGHLDLLETIASQASVALDNARLYGILKKAYSDLVNSLVLALEARDDYTAGHSQRVAEYAVMIAQAMGQTGDRLDQIRHASILHDVGKIGVPDSILLKRGLLSDIERTTMQVHPMLGFRIAGSSDFLKDARWIIRSHHERLDGRGYPERLAGDEISSLARVACVADSFDAMTTARPYRDPFPCLRAIDVLRECSGTQFDPFAVEAFISVLEGVDFSLREFFSRRPQVTPPPGL